MSPQHLQLMLKQKKNAQFNLKLTSQQKWFSIQTNTKELATGTDRETAKERRSHRMQQWRGITLMVVAAKVLVRIIITQIRDGIDNKLRQEQAGFRKVRGSMGHIYVCFVGFKKALDSVDRSVLWRIMRSYVQHS